MQKQRAKFKRDVQSLPIWEAKEQLVAQLKVRHPVFEVQNLQSFNIIALNHLQLWIFRH